MFLFITAVIIQILAGAEIDIFIPSFPQLQQVFHLTPFQVQFMLSANMVAYCIFSLFAGAFADRYDRRHVMLSTLVILTLGSILCVFAPNYMILVLGRILQGIGMAGPAVLAYPIIADNCPVEKQAGQLGILNGIVTLAMAFAPVFGSHVTLYFGWRGNFWVLCILSIFCLILSYFVIPHRSGDRSVSLSLKSYWELLCSSELRLFMFSIGFLVTPYWIFIGMAPILYMQNLGVSLAHFGYYQGAIAGTFCLLSLLSPKILSLCGQKRCLYTGLWLCAISTVLFALLAMDQIQNPMWITGVAMLLALGALFPITILFPLSLNVIPNSKARASALLLTARLILTAASLQVVSYFYDGTFFHTGLSMVIFMVLSLICIMLLIQKPTLQHLNVK